MLIVTGSEGFLGQRLCNEFNRLKRPVVRYDVQNDERDTVLDFDRMREVTDGYQMTGIVHLAGPVLGHVRKDPAKWFDIQVNGTFNAVRYAILKKVPLYLASSFYVYDGIPDDWIVNEQTPLRADDMEMFGFAKYAAEKICRETPDLTWVAMRFGSMYGGDGASNVVDGFREMGESGEVIDVWGDGHRRSQYTHVNDVADGIIRVMRENVHGRAVNLISPEVTTIRGLAQLMGEKYGYTFTFDQSKPEPDSMPYMSPNWAMEKLAWNPRTLREGLPD